MSQSTQAAPAVPATKHRKAANSAIRAARKHSPAITQDPQDSQAFVDALTSMLSQSQQSGDDSMYDGDEDSDGPDSLDS